MRYATVALALAGFLAACSPGAQPGATATAATPATFAANGAQHYTDPFAYCRAVGTIDRPGARYAGPNPPPAVIAGLIQAFHAPASASAGHAFERGTHWRCMGGQVYACNVGANLPCMAKANTERAPTPGERKYCAENHDSLYIPMYVTGHDTIYAWHCNGDQPIAGKTLSHVDARGYIADIWYKISPPTHRK